MWYILILVSLLTIALAKKPAGRRRRYNLRRVRVTPVIALSTLASGIVLTTAITGAASSTYRVVSIKAQWTLTAFTAAEGPISVGYAHSDYTVTEIKEALDIAASIDQGDKIAQEKANRLVRRVGTFRSEQGSDLNEGMPIKTRLNWLMTIGDSLVMWAQNESTSALTTGAFVNLMGDMWVKDSA